MSDATKVDAQWIRDAVQRYQRPLVTYVYRLTGDLETARDVVQDAFLKLCDQPRSKVEDHLAEWLFTVCRNRAFDVRRKNSRLSELSDAMLSTRTSPADAPEDVAEQKEATSQVLALLDELPENQRECIRLKFQHGMSYKQIAKVTDLTVSYVGWLIHTGIKNLRKKLLGEKDQHEREAG